MLSQFTANSYMYLCARVIDRTYVTIHSKLNDKHEVQSYCKWDAKCTNAMLKYAAMLEKLTFCLELLLLRTDRRGINSGL